MPLYLGLDCSTQSLTAILLELDGDRRGVVLESALASDGALPQCGPRHGVLPRAAPGIAVSPPLMWADALDVIMARVAKSGVDVSGLAAISGSAQQHGSVYLNANASSAMASLNPAGHVGEQLADTLSRPVAPIWMDSSTSEECAEIAAGVGGSAALAQVTGSRAFERFTGPQIK